VLHAKLGAELARELFGVQDCAIAGAIRKHTVGAAAMSPLDCILYLADSLEPGRDFAEREGIATLAFHDLNAAMRETIASSIQYLKERSLPVAPETLAAAQAFGVMLRDQEVLAAGTG
jgi:predicted HD superfamily hydrolase involved in NAD metabolism